MQNHLGSVSKKARKLFEESRNSGKKSIELFLEGVAQGLEDVDKNWQNRTPLEQQKRFDKVFNSAKKLMVDKHDGGECEGGLVISTFNSYKSVAKKVHIYHVRWQTAKRCSIRELQTARKVKDGVQDDHNGTQNLAIEKYKITAAVERGKFTEEDKMDLAVQALRDAAAERSDTKGDTQVKGVTPTTPWTLPDPDHSEDALVESMGIVFDYWDQHKFVTLINADTPEAKIIRRAMGDLRAYLRAKESADAA